MELIIENLSKKKHMCLKSVICLGLLLFSACSQLGVEGKSTGKSVVANGEVQNRGPESSSSSTIQENYENEERIAELATIKSNILSIEDISDEMILKYPHLCEAKEYSTSYEKGVVYLSAEKFTGINYFGNIELDQEMDLELEHIFDATSMNLAIASSDGKVIRLNSEESQTKVQLPKGKNALLIYGSEGYGEIEISVKTKDVSIDLLSSVNMIKEMIEEYK